MIHATSGPHCCPFADLLKAFSSSGPNLVISLVESCFSISHSFFSWLHLVCAERPRLFYSCEQSLGSREVEPRSDDHRIIFRAFQGIGGAGLFAMTPVIISEMVPPEKFGAYNALASSTIGISFLLGPLIGGAINNTQKLWRWIFLIKYVYKARLFDSPANVICYQASPSVL